MTSLNERIVLQKIGFCPECGTADDACFYELSHEQRELRPAFGKIIITTIRRLLCLNCHTRILEVTSDTDLTEVQPGSPSRFDS